MDEFDEFDEFEDFEEEQEQNMNLSVKLVEVYNQKIHHALVDGLYLHSGDLFALLESHRDEYLEHDLDDLARFTDQLIDRIRLMIVRRNNYE